MNGKQRKLGVVKSTLVTDTLTASDAVDSGYYFGGILSEIIFLSHGENVIPIKCSGDMARDWIIHSENVNSTLNVNEKSKNISCYSQRLS